MIVNASNVLRSIVEQIFISSNYQNPKIGIFIERSNPNERQQLQQLKSEDIQNILPWYIKRII